ncbi:sulfatase [Pelagicoccus sp. SDUM812005]|uniref:sulfatase n=1 Tax=Pelagicoccus sp. SDUM812005 TaxID=3041257 RepID=UPI00280C60C6|nr:sulfatase [Pelagicoccus sp. SDUM812005]MDQ8183134.1 sulfatase [Pelagicoccus sp. SDUM812005]
MYRLSFAILFCFANVLASHAGNQKKNVLIFFMDDLRPELGCYGETYIQTPNIDRLAEEGVLFERAYCQQAICGPSRISMLSGKYPDRLGIQDLWTQLRKSIPDAMSLPRYFKEAGYRTLSYGKVYHHHNDDQENWCELPNKPGQKYADPEVLESIRLRTAEAERLGLSVREKFEFTAGPATEAADVEDTVYQDGAVAEQAIDSLRRHQDKPFFMCVGFSKPHLPFAAPTQYWDLYEREQFEVPDRRLPEGAPPIAFTNWGELRAYQGMPKDGFLSDELTRELRHGYAASVSYADAQLGKVMAELERLGLRENTIVVMWGDHGYKLGEHGQWCKHTNFELDTRVPLIVSAPGLEKGKRTEALVEIIDLFPTLVKLTGGQVPEVLDGKSLEPVLADPSLDFRPYAVSEYRRGKVVGYTLRDARWRFTEWINVESKEIVATELYDHSETQLSVENLAGREEYSDLVENLSKQLDSRGRLAVEPLRKSE